MIDFIYVFPQSSSITILTERNCFVTFSRQPCIYTEDKWG